MALTELTPSTELPLRRMFDAVPGRYDALNRLFTLRLDESWRRKAAHRCLAGGPGRVLDLCCGTGDLTTQLARHAPAGTEIFGLDYSEKMLAVARSKAARLGGRVRLHFVEADAANMGFPDACFDGVGIAFAFRNLTWRNPLRDRALAEVHRVLRPGGRFVVVETSQPANLFLRIGFHAYLAAVVGPIGAFLSGRGGAYRYLARSARGFFDARHVSRMLGDAGFEAIRAEPLLGGVAAVHVGSRPRTVTPRS